MDSPFSDINKNEIPIAGLFKGASCFVTLSGPSLKTINLDLLKQPGIITYGVNNSPKVIRPNLWSCVDDPEKFMISVWRDPTITKIIPYWKHKKKVFDNTKWEYSEKLAGDYPNVVYYHRNEHFVPEIFLSEPTINWGNHKKYGGRRSVLMAVVKICYVLGFKKVFLLGCDFNMEIGKQNYAFDQDRSKGSVNCNNSTYQAMIERFRILRPSFEKENFFVFNCNKDSKLDVFPYVPFNDAIEIALKDFPDIQNENVSGMYERTKEK